MNKLFKKGVTLIELIVVLLIISLLSTIAVGVYTREVLRAKVARTRAEIRTLEVAVNRYQIDVGQFPPSSTGTALAPSTLDQLSLSPGCGYLQLAFQSFFCAGDGAYGFDAIINCAEHLIEDVAELSDF